MLTYGTSIHALKDRARLKQGETLLVLGAAGGVGLSAVELGKAMGARVVAAASSEEKVALARKHGADAGVVYPPGPFDKAGARALADLFKSACGENGADVIYATRVQKERFANEENEGYTPDFQINRAIIDAYCSPETIVMHPLPRDSRPGANDLSVDLNHDPRLAIFRQEALHVALHAAA